MEELDDDKPVGRILSRREMLALLGGAGVAFVAGTGFINVPQLALVGTATPTATALPSCVVRPQKTEGPYFVDEMLNRSDIRIEPTDKSVKEGVLLRLKIHVTELSDTTCVPIEGAQVDVWHCDALGVYSGVTDRTFDTTGYSWLRGYQVTDKQGNVEFLTIYPGWYSGRTVHIHFKIRTDPTSDEGYEFTSQFFFDEAMSDLIYQQEPYASKGQRDTFNADDNVYSEDGDQLLLKLEEHEDGGYVANFDIALDYSQTATDSFGGTGGGNAPTGTPPAPRR